MGKRDSSKTRVVPVFDQLHAKDGSGRSWLGKLMALPVGGNSISPAPPEAARLGRSGGSGQQGGTNELDLS